MLNSIWLKIKFPFAVSALPLSIILMLSLHLAACSSSTTQQQPLALPDGNGRLHIEIFGLRSDNGTALVSLFAGDNGFPDDTEKAALNLSVPIQAGKALLTTELLPYGRYGISVLHDENNNGVMDRNLLGLPTEGFGFSGKPDLKFGPPRYEEIHFLLVRSEQTLSILLDYETVGRQKVQYGPDSR